ncbi:hypothetical protein [Edaphobacter sp.]|uniref:hypothetical protein n=1 Tax=Edaphobacter sp. TaxID=1934404 RepID=UPI002DB75E2F|nr:hypothetical protein [Edaphobacter sp.]HEU5340251.1 hypothetical protein [Edaphobacter sp.]
MAVKNPPAFVDFPDWVYQGFLLHGWMAGHHVAGYALKRYAVPNSTTTVGLGLLDTVLTWQWAGKAWIAIYILLAGFATWMLSKATRGSDWRLMVALPGSVFFNLDFWYGHISFEMGMFLTFLLVALMIREASSVTLSLLLVLIFFTHMEACACALLFLGIWSWEKKQLRRLWVGVPAILLTAWYAVGRFSSGNPDGGMADVGYRYGSKTFIIYKVNTYFRTFGYVNVCDMQGHSVSELFLGRALFVLLIAASLCVAALIIWLMLRFLLEPDEHNGSHRSIKIFLVALLALSLFLPHTILGTADPGSRLLLMAVAIGSYFVRWNRPAGTMIACLSVLFCLVNLYQLARVSRGPLVQGRQKDLPAAILRYGHVEPAIRVHLYKAIEQGQMDQIVFTSGLFTQSR